MNNWGYKGFKVFVVLLTLVLALPVFSIAASATELTDNEKLHNETAVSTKGISVPNQKLKSEEFENVNVNMDDVKRLEAYLKLNADGTLTLDPSYTKLGISHSVTNEVHEWIKYLNGLVKQNEAVINSDFSVKILAKDGSVLTLDNGNNDKMKVAKKGCGRSGHKVYWWGYNLYFDCNETRTLYQSFKAGGGATTGLAAISRFIPVPPTQLASAIAGVIGGGLVGFGQMIQDEHEGHGVRIRFTGLGYAAVPTGVFPQ
ncbi:MULTISPECIES: hypothetical protein [Bacillus]|uniref:hypothetical protein n=1 Tax=Bacillus TaxID=1386 RepID=UPI0021177E65|nr:hypothetical protein [Bacillus sonorensis]